MNDFNGFEIIVEKYAKSDEFHFPLTMCLFYSLSVCLLCIYLSIYLHFLNIQDQRKPEK